MGEIMGDIGKILFGAFLSILVTFLVEEVKKRRRLRSASRVLLFELQRIYANIEFVSPEEAINSKSFLAAVDEYRNALFNVDEAKFEEHWDVYRPLMSFLDSDWEPNRKRMLLALDIRRRLGALLGSESPGSAERLGVPETGSPVRDDSDK